MAQQDEALKEALQLNKPETLIMATVTKRTWTSSGQEKTAWVVRYADQNKKWWLKRFEKKKHADTCRLRVEGEVKQGIHTPESQSVTVSQAAQLWLDTRELNRREQSTFASTVTTFSYTSSH